MLNRPDDPLPNVSAYHSVTVIMEYPLFSEISEKEKENTLNIIFRIHCKCKNYSIDIGGSSYSDSRLASSSAGRG